MKQSNVSFARFPNLLRNQAINVDGIDFIAMVSATVSRENSKDLAIESLDIVNEHIFMKIKDEDGWVKIPWYNSRALAGIKGKIISALHDYALRRAKVAPDYQWQHFSY